MLGAAKQNARALKSSLRSGERLNVRAVKPKLGKEKRMGVTTLLRKLMALAILSSVPVITVGVAQVATSGQAFAQTTTTCTGTGNGQVITFAAPGLSAKGTASSSSKSKVSAGSGTISCTGGVSGSGTVAKTKIKTKSTTTCSSDSNPPSGCTGHPTYFVYDSALQFAENSGDLAADIKSESWTIGGTTFTSTFSSSALASTCASNEAGFTLTGSLTAPAGDAGESVTVTACLLGDTGTKVTHNTAADIETELGGTKKGNKIVIATSTLDPSDSTIVFG